MTPESEHLQNIKEIRSLMERSSRFISLSGLSGVFAGIFALIGAWAAYAYLDIHSHRYEPDYLSFIKEDNSVNFDNVLRMHNREADFYSFFFLDASFVLLASLFVAIMLTTRKAKKQGVKIWDNTSKRMLLNMGIPLLSGTIFCLLLLKNRHIDMIAPATLIFYGMALLNASKYTLNDIRYLGISEIVLGLIATAYTGYGLLFWAIGFGLLHIVYGILMYSKYERNPQ